MWFLSFPPRGSRRETGVLSTATFQIGNIIIPRQRQSVSIESRRTNISLEMIFKTGGLGGGNHPTTWSFCWPFAWNHYIWLLWEPASPPRKPICCCYVVKHVIQSPFSIGILQTSVGASHPCTIAFVVQVRLAYGGYGDQAPYGGA